MLDDFIIPTIRLGYGPGKQGKQGCWMSALSVLVGEKWTDRLDCVDSTINSLCVCINDCFGQGKEANEARSRIILPRLFDPIGTAGDPLATERRRKFYADAAIRRMVPWILRDTAQLASDPHKANLLCAADKCEREGALQSLEEAKKIANTIANTIANAIVNANANANANAIVYANAYAIAIANANAYAIANAEKFVVEVLLPILDEMIDMGPHAKREEFVPACKPKKFLESVGAK